jgi:magnesium chelatase subunit D
VTIALSSPPLLAEPAWVDAAWAAALLAVDPRGLGGVVVRAGAGPVRDRWAADLRMLLPADRPLRRMPGHISDDRLLGGLDLAATLHSGKPVAQRGLLAESDGGLIAVPMAERLSAATAARLAGAIDHGEVGFERDGMGARWDARIGVVVYDEGGEEDSPPPLALTERMAFRLDLRALPLRACGEAAASAVDIVAARACLPEVQAGDEVIQALCATAMQLGVRELRASLLAVKAASAAAALAGRREVADEDAVLAVRLVLVPRATVLPATEPPPEPEPPQPPAEPAPDSGPEPTPPADPPPTAPDADANPPPPPPTPESLDPLEDRLVEAAIAALPQGLLAALQSAQEGHRAGRVGKLVGAQRGGRPVGTRRGEPRGGARLNLIETLRTAAPWQAMRRAAAPGPRLIHVHADDMRVNRLQQRTATATIFVIDASGSSALHRLNEAKGAINLLLADCYVRRDQVGVIGFRGATAELLLPPTRSLVRAKRSLAALPGGGGTPLAAALEAALRLSGQVLRAGVTPIVVLLTDGRANIARNGERGRERAEQDALQMARQMRAARVTTLVVDTSPRPAPQARTLAAELGAAYRALPQAGSAELSAAIKSLPRAAP